MDIDVSNFIKINQEDLIIADWNYKLKGDEHQNSKLSKSIKKLGTYGIIFAREIEDSKYEVVDGNHRAYILKGSSRTISKS